jgi:hypothetical protein
MEGTVSEDLKAVVRQKYGEAALRVVTGEKGTCCGTSCGCGDANFADPITRDLYEAVTTSTLPEQAVLASLGCGNPTALDVDAFASAVEGRFMAAFVRARKPESATVSPAPRESTAAGRLVVMAGNPDPCCGPDCCA